MWFAVTETLEAMDKEVARQESDMARRPPLIKKSQPLHGRQVPKDIYVHYWDPESEADPD